VAPHRHSPNSRDAALGRLAALKRLTAVGAVTLALGFTALAAQATPPRKTAHAAVTQTTAPARTQPSRHRAGAESTESDDRTQAVTPAPAPAATPAPAPTPQPPVVVSGGS